MIVYTVRPQNDNILIVWDKFWNKIVCDIFRHFKCLSQVRPRPQLQSLARKRKIQDFNGIRNHGLSVSAVELYQLSYEDPYVGNRQI